MRLWRVSFHRPHRVNRTGGGSNEKKSCLSRTRRCHDGKLMMMTVIGGLVHLPVEITRIPSKGLRDFPCCKKKGGGVISVIKFFLPFFFCFVLFSTWKNVTRSKYPWYEYNSTKKKFWGRLVQIILIRFSFFIFLFRINNSGTSYVCFFPYPEGGAEKQLPIWEEAVWTRGRL